MTQSTHDRPAGGADGADGAGRAVVPVLAFAGIVVAVMQTLIVPVIKDLPRLLDTTPGDATWVLTSTLLSGAVATPIMGRLGDLYGKRRMLVASLSVMVAGALVSALTSDLLLMIAGRTLQGVAMGAIPLGIGLMRDLLPPKRLGSAMALMSSSIGVGGGLALPAAALVAQSSDWHALYFGAAASASSPSPSPWPSYRSHRHGRPAPSTCRARWGCPPGCSSSSCPSPRAAPGAGRPGPRSACSEPRSWCSCSGA